MVMQLNGTITFLGTYELKIVNQNLSESITVPVDNWFIILRHKKSTNVIKCAIKINKKVNKTLQLCNYKNKVEPFI